MPRTSTDLPKLKSDAEEADWYATPQGRRLTQREFALALKDGKVIVPHFSGSFTGADSSECDRVATAGPSAASSFKVSVFAGHAGPSAIAEGPATNEK